MPGTAGAVRSTPAEPSYELRMAPTARGALQHPLAAVEGEVVLGEVSWYRPLTAPARVPEGVV